VGCKVKGNLSERVFLFEVFIVLSPKKIVIVFTVNPELFVVAVVVFEKGNHTLNP